MQILHPDQLNKEGRSEYLNEKYISAAELFKAAAEGFLIKGDKVRAAEMANDCSVAYLKGGNAPAALQAVEGTELIFSAMGDIKQQAVAVGNRAAALEKLKKFDEAMIEYEKCAGLLKEAGELELRAYVMQAISQLQLRKRRYLEAYATMYEGIMSLKKPNFKQRVLKSLIKIPYNFFR